MIKTEKLTDFEPNVNPFHQDVYHMGTRIGTNCYVMIDNHEHEFCKYLIVINTETGERLRVSFVEEQKTA